LRSKLGRSLLGSNGQGVVDSLVEWDGACDDVNDHLSGTLFAANRAAQCHRAVTRLASQIEGDVAQGTARWVLPGCVQVDGATDIAERIRKLDERATHPLW